MPLPPDNSPVKFPPPQFLTLPTSKRGVITLVADSQLPLEALKEANNLWLVEDGHITTRPGTNWYGTTMPNSLPIDGIDYFDFGGTIHLVAVAGGTIYRSTNDGSSWTACTGITLTSGVDVNMVQNSNFLYLTNGVDPIVRYDGTTVLHTYTALTTPAAPTIARTGLVGSSYTYYYKISAVNTVGFTAASTKATQQTSLSRDSWDATSNYLTLTMPAFQASQTRYDVYWSEDDLSYFYLGSSSSTTFKDDGSAIVVPSTRAPIDNTTTGPLVEELVNIGVRLYGVRDKNNRYRISFTGSGNFAGSFSNAYDGGYLDWQPGGKFIPIKVQDYDPTHKSATSLATVWCSSADGQGCVIQMSLDTLTVGNISITVPSAFILPGSRGTPSPYSVVNVLNDYIFYNTQAFYNLGPRAQFLNIISTDEISANIRPTVRQISSAAEKGITSVYFYAKVYISVPYGSTSNNATIVYDTERRAWLPQAFTIGFKRFLRYTSTDNSGNKTNRLLAVKPGDNQLSEISDSIQGDYGVPFVTSLVTGLYPTLSDRFGFQWTDEGEIELSNPQGVINVELLGIDRTKGFTSSNSVSITSVTTNLGWDTFNWDVEEWDDTDVVPATFSETSTKRYFNVQRELNAVQWHLTTNTLNARYILRTLQTWGTDTQAGHPANWLLGSGVTTGGAPTIDTQSDQPLLT